MSSPYSKTTKHITQFFIIYLLINLPFSAFAGVEVKPVSKDWEVLVWTDDFHDTKTCGVSMVREHPIIIFFVSSEVLETPYANLYISPRIKGVGIKYRIDGGNPVVMGYEYEFETGSNYYYIKGEEINKMVADFKKGVNLIYKITSPNRFINDETIRISLHGFTKAYNLAKELCQ